MMNFDYKGTQIDVEEIKNLYMIAMLMKYETLAILKNFYKEGFTEKAERLFHQEYDRMESFVEAPSKFDFLSVIHYGEELKLELGMKPEDEEIIREEGSQAMLNLEEDKRIAIEELTQRLMKIA